ncbi:MAG: hypothetical protein ACK5NE_09045 [Brachymonas sp.]
MSRPSTTEAAPAAISLNDLGFEIAIAQERITALVALLNDEIESHPIAVNEQSRLMTLTWGIGEAIAGLMQTARNGGAA